MAEFAWRAMTPADLAAVEDLAERIHVDHPEDAAVFAERLRLCPSGCRVLEARGVVAGYLVSHPALLAAPPALDTLLGALPAAPDTWYIHDLALAPAARGRRAAAAAVDGVAALALRHGLGVLSLIAVGGSASFWRAQGFTDAPAAPDKLASYGADARYMLRRLGK